ncbi:MAG: hypothetical protein Q7V88_01710 [Actinomycetota bacterium]|nr:hypothetical protein [Actinomycetota bacterium]
MPGNPFTDPNWAPDLADTVERVVGKVRTVATDNAVKASRGVVFGVLALIATLVAVPLLVILLLGTFRELLGFFVNHGRAVWISYIALGALLMIAGFFALKLRHSKETA